MKARASRSHVSVQRRASREIAARKRRWAAGRDEKGKVLSLQTEPPLELADAGDFEADHGFAVGVWVKLGQRNQGGAIVARMDNTKDYRGWDLWLKTRQGRHAHHQQVAGRRAEGRQPDALQPNEWTHVVVAYDGSKKAAGVKVYYNGQPQPTNVAADKLKSTIRTEVPFKIGQRHTSERLKAA
jgi:hypothetical protein